MYGGQLRRTVDVRPRYEAVAPVFRMERPRLVQGPLVDDERVATGELTIVVVRRCVRARCLAELVDRTHEVDETERRGETHAHHDTTSRIRAQPHAREDRGALSRGRSRRGARMHTRARSSASVEAGHEKRRARPAMETDERGKDL